MRLTPPVLGMLGPTGAAPQVLGENQKPQSRKTSDRSRGGCDREKRASSDYLDEDIPLGKVAKQIEDGHRTGEEFGTWQDVEPQEIRSLFEAMKNNVEEFDVKDAGEGTVTLTGLRGLQEYRVRIPYTYMEVQKFQPYRKHE